MNSVRVDANVILRFLTGEPEAQAIRAASLFRRVSARETRVVVDDIVIAEVVWTLSSYYRLSKGEVSGSLLELLSQDGIDCVQAGVVNRALVLFQEKNIDFIDAMVCARMIAAGESDIFSFDRHFDRVEGIRRVEPA